MIPNFKFNPFDPSERVLSQGGKSTDEFRLVKFCKREHNLARGCKTIRIGTTQYFQTLEASNELCDDTEGIGIYNQNSPDGSQRNNTVIVNMHNSYIFCTSRDDDPKFEGYDDKYYINDIDHFGKLLCLAISQQLNSSDFANGIHPDRLAIHHFLAPITYGKVSTSNEPLADEPDPVLVMQDLPFRKPLRYQLENEFRMVFMPVTLLAKDGKEYEKFHPLSANAKMTFNVAPLTLALSRIISLD